MRMLAIAAAATLFAAGVAHAEGYGASAPQDANGTCLWQYNIVKTDVAPDEHSIVFHMKDGKTWVNTLPSACRGLNLHGFSYVTRTSDEICGGQGIRLVQTGTVCELGQFAPGPTENPAHQY